MYNILNINALDTPALVVFPEIVRANIKAAINMVDDVDKLRPHIKTHKTAEVIKLCQAEGIKKFKCATIAEAELLGICQAEDVLFAYQPIGPKATRFVKLIQKYNDTKFSCLIDQVEIAQELSNLGMSQNIVFQIYIDLNIGQNRTGIEQKYAIDLINNIKEFPNILIVGIHAYDGHINDQDFEIRKQKADVAYDIANTVKIKASQLIGRAISLIMSGSPTFSIHAHRPDLESSPGTFVFWDFGYSKFAELPFKPAVLAVTRVISIPTDTFICTDLGHKSIASEKPIQERIHFLHADLLPVSQSEEHLVLQIPASKYYKIGEILMGIPHHICPTIALFDQLFLVNEGRITGETWRVIARDRCISI